MLRVCLLLTFFIFPSFLNAQEVTLTIFENQLLVAPGVGELFLSFDVTSQEPIRVQECEIVFPENLFESIEKVSVSTDQFEGFLSLQSGEFFNPWSSVLTTVVGLGDDTVRRFDYHMDVGPFMGDVSFSFTCWVDPYVSGGSIIQLGPYQESLSVVLGVPDLDHDNLVRVTSLQGGVSVEIFNSIVGSVSFIDVTGKLVWSTRKTDIFYGLPSGIYICTAEDIGFSQRFYVE